MHGGGERRGRGVAAVAVIAAVCAFAAAPASAAPVRANVITAFDGKVACGVNLKAAGGGISCFSEALPSTELDGYLELHQRGKTKTGERGDSPWRSSKGSFAKFKRGQVWRRAGVRCFWRAAFLNCSNEQGHGFKLSPTAYFVY
jgi:hypothetical protein